MTLRKGAMLIRDYPENGNLVAGNPGKADIRQISSKGRKNPQVIPHETPLFLLKFLANYLGYQGEERR